MSANKVALVVGGHEVLVNTGLHGTIGILVPFFGKDDVGFMSTLEQHIRAEQISLVGRDHLAWRGYYVPKPLWTETFVRCFRGSRQAGRMLLRRSWIGR